MTHLSGPDVLILFGAFVFFFGALMGLHARHERRKRRWRKR